MQCLLSQPDLKTKTGVRDRAILELFYSTGIRRGELLGLELFDVDLPEKSVRVRKGKGGKERLVPLGDEAAVYLERYLQEVRPIWCRKNPGVRVLFLAYTGRALDSQALQHIVKKYAERSRIRKKIDLGTRIAPYLRLSYARRRRGHLRYPGAPGSCPGGDHPDLREGIPGKLERCAPELPSPGKTCIISRKHDHQGGP